MRQGGASTGFLGMVESTLGKVGARLAGIAYLFLHYALLVAYIAQGGEILLVVIEKIAKTDLPAWVGTTIFAVLFGGIMYFGRPKLIEKFNHVLVFIVIVSFAGLLILAAKQVQIEQFAFQNWTGLTRSIPVMLVALFYHNVIPVIATHLQGDVRKIRQSIFLGSLIPLLMFITWNSVILISVNLDNIREITDNISQFDPLLNLRGGSGGECLGILVSVFSWFAIITSFIGFVYGLLDFFKDVTKSSTLQWQYALILFPPTSVAALNPNIFLHALESAGAFSISISGAILPALMVWKRRHNYENLYNYHRLVPGGKIILIAVVTIAILVIFNELFAFWTDL
ncbi:MAG: tyrosine transporter [Calothrix sp. C42_A2020_038]|nr:tyrosine transporter [Calothrix sp. C42_A2020_038]